VKGFNWSPSTGNDVAANAQSRSMTSLFMLHRSLW
jgi:hypothetical protein